MIPCVYYRHKTEPIPMFLASCENVGRAVALAYNIRHAFGVRTWVADWRAVAHKPSIFELAMIAAGEAAVRTGAVVGEYEER